MFSSHLTFFLVAWRRHVLTNTPRIPWETFHICLSWPSLDFEQSITKRKTKEKSIPVYISFETRQDRATFSSQAIITPIFISFHFIVAFQFFTSWLLQVYRSSLLTFWIKPSVFQKSSRSVGVFVRSKFRFLFTGSVVVKLGGTRPHPSLTSEGQNKEEGLTLKTGKRNVFIFNKNVWKFNFWQLI